MKPHFKFTRVSEASPTDHIKKKNTALLYRPTPYAWELYTLKYLQVCKKHNYYTDKYSLQ